SNLSLTVFITVASLQTTRLESSAVRGRSQLTVSILSRDPSLGIKLAGSRSTQVTAGNVDDSIVQVHRIEHLALHGQQLLMLLLGVFRLAIGEHFNLVELVDAQNAAGILTVGTSFTTETRRPASVLNWPLREVDDFIFVVARERYL